MTFAPVFNQSCDLVTNSRNRYGDYILGATVTVSCWFRQIDRLTRAAHGEENDADAMVWFPVGTSVSKGQLVIFSNICYQIERINEARTPWRAGIQFIKCDLKITDQAVS